MVLEANGGVQARNAPLVASSRNISLATYLGFVVGPRQDADGAEMFVEGKMRQVERTVGAEVHRWKPVHVAVAMDDRQMQSVRHHLALVETAAVSTAGSLEH